MQMNERAQMCLPDKSASQPTLSMWNDPDVYLPSEFTEASNQPHIVLNRHWDYGD